MAVICIKGKNVLINGALTEAIIEIENGLISKIIKKDEENSGKGIKEYEKVIDAGNLVVMAGLVDSHVHVNEPGRTEWEGFWSATKAAAAGGITTIVDMPLNSIPPTTTVENLNIKKKAATGKCHVDVGFWGGVVPDNAGELKAMVKEGVVGFKCFLIHSGVDEFPCVNKEEVDKALEELKGTGSLLAFHAELDCGVEVTSHDPAKYGTFLESRPQKMEYDAIDMVAQLVKKHKDIRCHIVHLSAAEALPIIKNLKSNGFPITIETCPHYLTLKAEEIIERSTEFKCCPPIRDSGNQEKLWDALNTNLIDMIVSDHSPCTAELKKPGEKDFMQAWGGISSVQFGLPIIWTNAKERGFGLKDISKWMSKNPANLSGFGKFKGDIKEGFDADFVIWDQNEKIEIVEGMIQHKNKITPYKNKTYYGKVYKTILRGQEIFTNGTFSDPKGKFLSSQNM